MTIHIDTGKKETNEPAGSSRWMAQLDLEISAKEDKSVVSHSRQRGPLTIQSPFYPEQDVCHIYLLHPPAGIVGGDRLGLSISVHDGGAALITTPGATKFYRSNSILAEQHQTFTIQEGAILEWLPQETIYFPDANASLNTTVHLEKSAHFIGWEVHCLGLPVNAKDFGTGKARIRFSLYREGEPLLIECLKISEEKKQYQKAFLQDKPVVGSLVATGADLDLLELLREGLIGVAGTNWGATLLEDILIVRYLGDSTNQARKLFIEIWKIIRPHILQRDAVLPRIWAT